jgi:hypothetical protein
MSWVLIVIVPDDHNLNDSSQIAILSEKRITNQRHINPG